MANLRRKTEEARARWWCRAHPRDRYKPPDLVGEWPSGPYPSTDFHLPFDPRTREPLPTIVAVVSVADHTDVPAALGWDVPDRPRAEEHVAVLRRWARMYGARLVGISYDVIEMHVATSPSSRQAAMVSAEEHFSYCPDVVMQGVGTVSALASLLLNGTTWYFWWD